MAKIKKLGGKAISKGAAIGTMSQLARPTMAKRPRTMQQLPPAVRARMKQGDFKPGSLMEIGKGAAKAVAGAATGVGRVAKAAAQGAKKVVGALPKVKKGKNRGRYLR